MERVMHFTEWENRLKLHGKIHFLNIYTDMYRKDA